MSAASRRWVAADGAHLDVRVLNPRHPFPARLSMVLGAAGLPVSRAAPELDPAFVYPQLAERGWIATPVDAEPGEVRLRLERAP